MSDSPELIMDSYFLKCFQTIYLTNLESGAEDLDPLSEFYFFQRKLGDGWSHLTMSGVEQILQHLDVLCKQNPVFSDETIEYLRDKGYDNRTLEYLKKVDFKSVKIESVPDGTPTSANIPLLKITGPISVVSFLESYINGAIGSNMAWASFVSNGYENIAKELGVEIGFVDNGLRGTNPAAAEWMSYSYGVGGGQATSNELAAKKYGISERGTMYHGYVLQMIVRSGDEFSAFYNFGKQNPQNAVFLVDTVNVTGGVTNAILAATKLKNELGNKFKFSGVRIDSGNSIEEIVSYYKFARKAMNQTGFSDAEVFLSGDMEPEKIISIVKAIRSDVEIAGEKLPRFAVGRALAKTYPMGITAKILGIQNGKDWEDLMKLALDENGQPTLKQTYTGDITPYELYDNNGNLIANVVVDKEGIEGIGKVTKFKMGDNPSPEVYDLSLAYREGRLKPMMKVHFDNGRREGEIATSPTNQKVTIARAIGEGKRKKMIVDENGVFPTYIDSRLSKRMREVSLDISERAHEAPHHSDNLSEGEINRIRETVSGVKSSVFGFSDTPNPHVIGEISIKPDHKKVIHL